MYIIIPCTYSHVLTIGKWKGYEKMSNPVNDIFGTFGIPKATQQSPMEEKQEPAAVQAKDPSESERKAYAAYRQAVSSYGKLTADRSRAISNLEQQKKQQGVFPAQVQKLQKERDSLLSEKNTLEEERRKQQQGGTGASLQIKNVQCDEQAAAMIRTARDNRWMTTAQLEYMNKPCSEVCAGTVLKNAENVDALEKSLKNTDLYKQLVSGQAGPETVKQAMSKISTYVFGGMLVIFLLARLTQWDMFGSLAGWICGLALGCAAALVAFIFTSGKGILMQGFATLIAAVLAWSIGATLSGFVISGGWIMAIIIALLLSGVTSAVLTALGSNKVVLPILQNFGFMKSAAHKEAFKNAEPAQHMNEALYCYCNHDAVMDYLRQNARQNWIAQLDAGISEKTQQIVRKEQQIQEVQNTASKISAQLQTAQAQVAAADAAIISANRSLRAWQGQPDMEMANSQFADMICMESAAENSLDTIINHRKKPVVFYYNGDATLMNPAGQIADQLARVIDGFTKMNPAGLMQVSLIDMVGGAISLSMDSRFRFVDWSELKNYTSDGHDGDIFRVGNREELREFHQLLDAHCKSLMNYTGKHREQLQGRSGIEQVNKLRAQEGQSLFRYQVMVILVPREDDRDDLGQEAVMSYLQDANISVPYGIIPVFFVNESSIHKRWKPTIDRCKENQLRIKVR